MINLAKYAGMRICVAVSGGKDSMALLHYLYIHSGDFGIKLSALNCDHKMRGESSARDSAFVREWCLTHSVPLISFVRDCPADKTESTARLWRLKCYLKAIEPQTLPDGSSWEGADAVATAHHLNDNAETVLFNLARGSALSGLTGITDFQFPAENGDKLNVIHPLISCPREEIDAYIAENKIPFVEDETNFTDNYTRNKIRHNVIPELEKAVPDAVKAIYRFSRLAAEDEQYFDVLIEEQGLIKPTLFGKEIGFCKQKVVFRRAAVKVVKDYFGRKDYTSEHIETLYNLQFSENGKKFGFLNLTALKEEGKITVCENSAVSEAEEGRLFTLHCAMPCNLYCGQFADIVSQEDLSVRLEIIGQSESVPRKLKLLKFDLDSIPDSAVIRFMKRGDKFTKFGGGTKNLGDYFTDKKIPSRIRGKIPLIADGNDVLAVGGVEISDKIKITNSTEKIFYLICADYQALK